MPCGSPAYSGFRWPSFPLAAALAWLLSVSSLPSQSVIRTVAGGGPDGLPAPAANVAVPSVVMVAPAGDLLIGAGGQVFKVDGGGTLSLVAGRSRSHCFGLSVSALGDGGPAPSTCLSAVRGLALDAAGALYIADSGGDVVMGVDPATGLISRAAGTYSAGFAGDGLPATHSSVRLKGPYGIALDAAGNHFIAGHFNHRVRRVDAATGIITTVVGNGVVTGSIDGEGGLPADDLGDGGPASSATLEYPSGLAFDSGGNLHIGEMGNNRVRRIDAATGVITTVAGNGVETGSVDGPGGFAIDELGDGGAASSATFSSPFGVAVDAAGNLFIGDTGNSRVRRVDAATGVITTVAGNGVQGHAGDGGPATSANLVGPAGIAFDPDGNLYLAESNDLITVPLEEDLNFHRVRRLDAVTGVITTVAGNGSANTSGDGGPATSAGVPWPGPLALDGDGNLYIQSSWDVRRVDASTGVITTAAGTHAWGISRDGALAGASSLTSGSGLAADAAGNVFVSESGTDRIRLLTLEPPAAGVAPDGDLPGERPLSVDLLPAGDLRPSWDRSCVVSDGDFAVYQGTHGDFSSHAPVACSTGGATALTFTPGPGDRYYLVVPRNARREGSYGLLSDGSERPSAPAACAPQAITNTCP